ncbi:MAG: hypothetical protein A2X86_13415 [Bdellovibrionales bacterium GWA2_49_15]|nr:MAG: hypothetical protein A2X86_13415 [Bdellovibrionales bacterium GWA2_49_15]HAZ13524.1 hypothetical protein [Bdellovibrionales bacterium]
MAKVLAHFQEIESRKLYLELGYGSLFLFAVKELGYKEASAQRRIEAMRFLKKTPVARTMVEKGHLNLSNLSLLERVTREAQTTHAQNVAALNLIQEEPNSAAEAESKLRGYFKLENKKRVVKKDAIAIKKLCESQVEKPQKKVRQAPTARTAGVVLKRELLKQADHQCEYVSPSTGRRCDNRHFLQADHREFPCERHLVNHHFSNT